jgi:hypothetical protein
MRDQQPLIDRLAAELAPVRRFRPARIALSLWALAWVSVVAMTLLTGPLRHGAMRQLLDAPQFAVESLVGLLAGALLTCAALMLAAPGRHGSRWLRFAVFAFVAWVGAYVIGLVLPALEPSMLGKRAACDIEVVAFSIPVLLVGAWALRRGYLLDGWLGGLALGLAAGAVPALLMEFACMYDPAHILIHHLAPVAVTGLLGVGLGRAVAPRPMVGKTLDAAD